MAQELHNARDFRRPGRAPLPRCPSGTGHGIGAIVNPKCARRPQQGIALCKRLIDHTGRGPTPH